MTSSNWRLIWQICEGARRLPSAERSAYVRANIPDPVMAREAISLLEEPDESVFPSWSPASSSGSAGGGTAVTTARALAGLRIGKYVVGDLVGRGGSGDVYSAQDTDLDRTVAMKFFHPGTSDAQWRVDWLLREAKAASALNHPGIITVHEVIQSESGLAIVMEFVAGTAMRTLCGRPNPVNQVIRCGTQIAGALSAAHERGIIHRDVKPENIMIRADGLAKVLDFGLAQFLSREEDTLLTQFRVGTLRYMSPEQAHGEILTPATDVFSLGLVLYELAAGRHPFPAESVIEAVQAITSSTPDPPSRWQRDIPKPLDALILEMLAKAPQARPTSAEVARRLDEMSRPPAGLRSGHWRTAALAALAAVFASGAWFSLRQPRRLEPIAVTPIPITATTGFDSWPDVSPNGDAVVYGWGASPDAHTHLYLKRFDQDAPLQLVEAEPGTRIGHPRWASDGQRIYFKRTSPRGGTESIWSVSRDGSDRRQTVSLTSAELSSGLDCSPDGKRIIYTDRPTPGRQFGIVSFDIASGGKTFLTTPSDGWGDWDPRLSPDGKSIAFKRVQTAGDDRVWIMPAAGGPARPLTSKRHSVWGHGWLAPDHLLVSSQIGSVIHGLWAVSTEGSGEQQPVFESGLDAVMPSVGKNKIAWVNRHNDYNIYSVPLAGGTPAKRIASTMLDSKPAFALDGRLAYVSRRSGSPEIWIAGPDGANPVRITNLRGDVGRPAWSPDGSRIAFSMRRFGETRVFLARCVPGELRCDTPEPLTSGANPTWSADGKILYFASEREDEIWKMPIAGGTPVHVAPGLEALESSDGAWLYFTRLSGSGRFFRIPVGGGAKGGEEMVLGRGTNSAGLMHWTLAGDEIVFWESNINSKFSGLRAYHTVTKRLRTVTEARAAEYPTISADGKTVWFAQPDAAGGTVMVAERGH